MSRTPCMFLPVSSVCCWHTFGCDYDICCIRFWNLPVLKDSTCDHFGVQGVSAGRTCWTADYSRLGCSIALACEVAHTMLRDSIQHVRLLLSCVSGSQGTSAAVMNALLHRFCMLLFWQRHHQLASNLAGSVVVHC